MLRVWSGVEERLLNAELQNCVQELGEEAVSVENEDRSSCNCWDPGSSELPYQTAKSMHSRRNQAAMRNCESILGYHTLECRRQVLCTPLAVLPAEWRRHRVWSVMGHFLCNQNKML